MKPGAVVLPTVDDVGFKAELVKLIPHLRAFAFSISRAAEAEDLAQDAMVKAWRARASFEPGSNFKAWVFTILRNQHTSLARRAWRSQPLDPGVAESTLMASDDPMASEELLDVRSAMLLLSFEQRQALALVGAAGLSYKETAEICGCAEGTVKSRVSRARAELLAILDRRKHRQRVRTNVPAARVFETIMAEAAAMQNRDEPRSSV
ncbi:MAG: sigma-70 family RNA polymerase sigma factor [Hyphomonadaceae bacterium]|nr:sigma-70 family RNA polymerase sigma factor [Hyphomonadaceae bacterium]MBP9233638.1 sigma-70 family RNA polymerase sigma factor [Hyphomonadaceae bacterium]